MIREYRRKKSYYTTFKKLKNGDRFRTNPAQNGPFVKSGPRVYEDARIGDDTTQTWINQPVPIKEQFKEQMHVEDHYALSAAESRADYGDGVGGGDYTKPEPVLREYFEVAVQDLEEYLENGFDKTKRVPN